MNDIILNAHYDGERIVLDEPYDLDPGTELLIVVMPKLAPEAAGEDPGARPPSATPLSFGDDELDYPMGVIKAPNVH